MISSNDSVFPAGRSQDETERDSGEHEMKSVEVRDYGWDSDSRTEAHDYLVPAVLSLLPGSEGLKILDVGCGNGYLAGILAGLGHHVVGVDVARDGIGIARKSYPQVRFEETSIYDDRFEEVAGNGFDVIVSLEVIEHLYRPRVLLQKAGSLMKPGGKLIISTPYHGYWKNLAISVLDGWDKHFAVDWDGGHIKFFSEKTLKAIVAECGFSDVGFNHVGRVHGLWKSMICSARKGIGSEGGDNAG